MNDELFPLPPRHSITPIHTNYVLTVKDLESMCLNALTLSPNTSVSLSPPAKMVVDLVSKCDLTDFRGLKDARLNRVRVAIWNYLCERNPVTFKELSEAYGSVFCE